MKKNIIVANELLLAIANGSISNEEIFEMVEIHASIVREDIEGEFLKQIKCGLEKFHNDFNQKYFPESETRAMGNRNKRQPKELYSRKEVIAKLQICEKTFYNYSQSGLKVHKPHGGRKIYVYSSDLDDFLKSLAA